MENNNWNQTSYHQNTFKMRCLLSPLKLHLLKIALKKTQAKFDRSDQSSNIQKKKN